MRLLTIRQPWADAIVDGRKQIETRIWTTGYRGPVIIRAGFEWGPAQRRKLEYVRNTFGVELPEPEHFGGIVGVADIVEARAMRPGDELPALAEPGDENLNALVMANPRRIPFIPMRKGVLSLVNASPELEEQVLAALGRGVCL